MTEKETPFAFTQAGQPGKPAAGTGDDQTATTQAQAPSGYVTKAELEAAIAEVKRMTQSMTGKAEARISKQMEALQKHGIQATPQQVADLLADAEQETAQQPQAQPPKAQAAQPDGDTGDEVNAKALAIFEAAGIDPATVTENDEDFALIEKNAETAEEYLASIYKFTRAKKARMDAAKGAPSRIPTLPGAANAAGGKTAVLQELNTLLKNPGPQNIQRIHELRLQLAQYK